MRVAALLISAVFLPRQEIPDTWTRQGVAAVQAADFALRSAVDLGFRVRKPLGRTIGELLDGTSSGAVDRLQAESFEAADAVSLAGPDRICEAYNSLIREVQVGRDTVVEPAGDILAFRRAVVGLAAGLNRAASEDENLRSRLGPEGKRLAEVAAGLPKDGSIPTRLIYTAALEALVGSGGGGALADRGPRTGAALNRLDVGLRNLLAVRASELDGVLDAARGRLRGSSVARIEAGARMAERLRKEPQAALPSEVLRRLAASEHYAIVECNYEARARRDGAVWTESAEGTKMREFLEQLRGFAATSSWGTPAAKVITVTANGRLRKLSNVPCGDIEGNAEERGFAAGHIADLLLRDALDKGRLPPLLAAAGWKAAATASFPTWRDRARAAAQQADWPSAIAALSEGLQRLPCSPALLYDLGVAHERAGNPVAAMLWWRACLEADPRGPHANSLRLDISRLSEAAESGARRKLREAVDLAQGLSVERPADGKSLRGAALEMVARRAYFAGQTEVADRASAAARTLHPEAAEDKDLIFAREASSLSAAFAADDAVEAEEIRKSLKSQTLKIQADLACALMNARLGRTGEARQLWSSYEGKPLRNDSRSILVLQVLWEGGEVAAAEDLLGRLLKDADRFEDAIFTLGTELAERAFWRGEDAAASRIAKLVLSHFDAKSPRPNLGDTTIQTRALALAISRNFDMVETLLRGDRWYESHFEFFDTRLFTVVALIDVQRAKALAEMMLRPIKGGLLMTPELLKASHPVLPVTFQLLTGSEALARRQLEICDGALSDGKSGSREEYKRRAGRILELALRLKRTDLAIEAARVSAEGMSVVDLLRHQIPRAAEGDRAKLEAALLERLAGGAAREYQAGRRIARWIERAAHVNPDHHAPVSGAARAMATTRPQDLPGQLAFEAAMSFVAARAARLP